MLKKKSEIFLHLNLSFHLVTGEGGWHCGRRPGAGEGAFQEQIRKGEELSALVDNHDGGNLKVQFKC